MKKSFTILTFIFLSISGISQNIFETLSESPQHSLLIDKIGVLNQIGVANLADILSGPGPLTIFAPTDEAFEIVSTVESANLTGGIPSLLLNTLSGHIVQDSITSNGFILNQSMSTLFENHDLTINSVDNNYLVTNNTETANIIMSDIVCSNGVIHVIDRVLILGEVGVNNTNSNGFIIKNVNGQLHINNNSNTSVKITSTNGQIVYSKMFNNDIIIDTDFLQTGIYIISIENDGKIHFSKFFK